MQTILVKNDAIDKAVHRPAVFHAKSHHMVAGKGIAVTAQRKARIHVGERVERGLALFHFKNIYHAELERKHTALKQGILHVGRVPRTQRIVPVEV